MVRAWVANFRLKDPSEPMFDFRPLASDGFCTALAFRMAPRSKRPAWVLDLWAPLQGQKPGKGKRNVPLSDHRELQGPSDPKAKVELICFGSRIHPISGFALWGYYHWTNRHFFTVPCGSQIQTIAWLLAQGCIGSLCSLYGAFISGLISISL